MRQLNVVGGPHPFPQARLPLFAFIPSRKPNSTPPRKSRKAVPSLETLESRLAPYSASGNAWPAAQLVTISFVPGGTIVSTSGASYVTSNLFSTFNTKFGSTAAWQNVILQAAQVWAQQTNLNFTVVSDNGTS